MLFVLPFPMIDPVIVQVGPLTIRWYALAYITALVLGWRIARRLMRAEPAVASVEQVDDFLTWATLGVVLGGRLGYVLFYQPSRFLASPLEIFAVWQGGMAFHGGALGVVIAVLVFCWKHRISVLGFGDRVAAVVPIGLGLGRIANFINAELWGRVAPDWLPWAMVFPTDRLGLLRHPSQLYQAGMEGVLLGLLMLALATRPGILARQGFVAGAVLAGYAVARMIGELFREPDAFLGFLAGGVTMGQVLSVPMLLVGVGLMATARVRRAA